MDPLETQLNHAYKLEEQGDRYSGDLDKSTSLYTQALAIYLQLCTQDNDSDTLYNAARLCLLLYERVSDPVEKLKYLDQAITLSNTVLQASTNNTDALFNLAQAYLWKSQLYIFEDHGNGTEVVSECLRRCFSTVQQLIPLQKSQLNELNQSIDSELQKSDVDSLPQPENSPTISNSYGTQSGEIVVTESMDVTATSVLESILLLIECHAVQVSLASTSNEIQSHQATVTELLSEAKELANSIPPLDAGPQSSNIIDLTQTDPSSCTFDCLFSESNYYRAQADRLSTLSNDPSITDVQFQNAINPLQRIITQCHDKIHIRANCDAGDIYTDWYTLLVSRPDLHATRVWELMALATKHYTKALSRAPKSITILAHLAENEWNRAMWTRHVSVAETVQLVLYKNTAVYAERGWQLLRKQKSGDCSSERDTLFAVLCQSLQALDRTSDLQVLLQSGP